MPRAKKPSPVVADAAPTVTIENPTKVRKGKRPAEDPPTEVEAVPQKAPRTATLARSKQPAVNGETTVAPTTANPKKRPAASPPAEPKASNAPVKKAKKAATASAPEFTVETGTLHCIGQNDCGQIGLPLDQDKRRYPALVPALEGRKIVQVVCGGMHTLALEADGTVWSFGVNDDLALGREAEEEEDAAEPGKVKIPGKVVQQISAGDSHSAALTTDGVVYAWGTFKDDNGNIGLIPDGGPLLRKHPEEITAQLGVKIKQIASGVHHIAMLGENGLVYSCGTDTQGQLGRQRPASDRVLRGQQEPISIKEFLLRPALVKIGRNTKFSKIWTGEYSTYCMTEKGQDIYVFGLNNYGQLGKPVHRVSEKNVIIKPTKSTSFRGITWKQIAGGQHHAVALDEDGTVYTIGRGSDGRLGLENAEEIYEKPQVVESLRGKPCIQVAAGVSTSYAITSDGHLYAWGFGENLQLATGDEDDRNVPTRCVKNKSKEEISGKVVCVDAGGQHAAMTISLPPPVTNGKA